MFKQWFALWFRAFLILWFSCWRFSAFICVCHAVRRAANQMSGSKFHQLHFSNNLTFCTFPRGHSDRWCCWRSMQANICYDLNRQRRRIYSIWIRLQDWGWVVPHAIDFLLKKASSIDPLVSRLWKKITWRCSAVRRHSCNDVTVSGLHTSCLGQTVRFQNCR